MAIENMYQVFINQLDKIEKVRKESAETYDHHYYFPLNKVTQVIKSATAKVITGARITTTNPGFTAGSDTERFVDKHLDDVYYKVYTITNIRNEFKKKFPGAILTKSTSKTNPGISIIEGSYQQKKSGNAKRDRTIVTDNLLVEAVNKLIELVAKEFDDANPATTRMGDRLRKKTSVRNKSGNYDSRKVQGIGLGLHGDMDNDTTVAMIAVLQGIKKMSQRPLPQMSSAAMGAVQTESKILNNVLGVRKGFEISKNTLEDYMKNPKLVDTIEISIEYGTNLSQSEMKEFDAKEIRQNLLDAQKAALDGLEQNQAKWGKDYVAMKGSPSLKERMTKGVPSVASDALLEKVNKKFIKNKKAAKAKVTKNTKSKSEKRNSKKRSSKTISKKQAKGTKVTYARAQQSKTKNINSAVALKELINQALPEVMLRQMHPPALRNRTGRFRQSAEVTNVMIGPRGGTNIEYTYMRDPYQTFEPGGEMGSRNRDPRKLIGASVREIAIKLTGNKFITTRRR